MCVRSYSFIESNLLEKNVSISILWVGGGGGGGGLCVMDVTRLWGLNWESQQTFGPIHFSWWQQLPVIAVALGSIHSAHFFSVLQSPSHLLLCVCWSIAVAMETKVFPCFQLKELLSLFRFCLWKNPHNFTDNTECRNNEAHTHTEAVGTSYQVQWGESLKKKSEDRVVFTLTAKWSPQSNNFLMEVT